MYMYFTRMHLRSKTTFTMSMDSKIIIKIMGNSPYVFILKLDPDLNPEH